jgi:hypothetical protein
LVGHYIARFTGMTIGIGNAPRRTLEAIRAIFTKTAIIGIEAIDFQTVARKALFFIATLSRILTYLLLLVGRATAQKQNQEVS